MSEPVVASVQSPPQASAATEIHLPPPPARASGYIRVAVAQLSFLPSAAVQHFHILEQPALTSATADWFKTTFENGTRRLRELQRRIGEKVREIYVEHETLRLRELMNACAEWGVEVLVLPEYSVPPECLEHLLPATKGMTVVFGTHSVEPRLLDTGFYDKFDTRAPLARTSVAPVAVNGVLKTFQPKLNATHLENGMVNGQSWEPVALHNSESLGVLICLDFLKREDAQYRTLVGPKIDNCTILAVPSLTPDYTVERFDARAFDESSGYGRAVLYADIASGGGTSIYAISALSQQSGVFPYALPALAADEEGVIVADLDVERTRTAEKVPRTYSGRKAVVPVAASVFRYRSTVSGADHVAGMSEILRDCDLTSRTSINAAIEHHSPLLSRLADASTPTAATTLNAALETRDQARNAEDLLCQLRHVAFSDAVLPRSIVERLRALAALDEAEAFQASPSEEEGAARLRRRLRELCGGAHLERARALLTPEAQRRFDKLRAQYKPKECPDTESPVALELGTVAVSLCREELTHAKAAFDAFRWRESATLYSAIRRQAEAVRAASPSQPEIDAVIASSMLGEAVSVLNLQEPESASLLLSSIDDGALTDRQRCAFATALAHTGAEGRARAVLDLVPAPSRDELYWREADQVVDMLGRGILPTPPIESASVLNALAHYCLTHSLVAKAGEVALQGLAIEAKSPMLSAGLLMAAMASLLRTLYEDDLADDGVPVVARRKHAERIAETFPSVFSADLPESTRLMLIGAGLNYASSLGERQLLSWLLDNTDEGLRGQVVSPDGARALDLATEGKLTEAIEALPNPGHPWRHELRRCQLYAIANDVPRAADELRALATRWPNRFPIHADLAELLTKLAKHGDATEHAELAYHLFPSDSAAELLARCSINTKRGARALEVLADRPESDTVAELRAHAADQAQHAAATTYWTNLLKYRPQSRAARLGLSLALLRIGDAEGAARQARDLATREIERLERDELAACGQVLSQARFLPGANELIHRIAEELRTRFPEDDTAEFQRLTLVSALGFPDDVKPINYALLTKAGRAKPVSLDDVVDMLGRQQDLTIATHRAYREGWLSFDSFAELTGARAADVVVRWTATSTATRLRAPIQPTAADSFDLRDKTFACTALELLLLGHGQLLGEIPKAIGDGRLVATQDVWTQMLEDAYFLEQSAQRNEATRLRAFIGRLSTFDKATEQGSEREVAAARGCRFVSSTAVESTDLDAMELLAWIAASGRIAQGDLKRAAQHLGRPLTTTNSHDLKNVSLFFASGLLDLLDRAGVLEVVLESSERIVISSADVEVSRARLRELELAGEAAKLQREVLQRLGEAQRVGWFALIAPPPPVALPAIRGDVDEERAKLLTHSIRGLLPLKNLLVEHSDWYRVTADSYGFDSVGHPDQWRALDFTPADGEKFVTDHWMRKDREISLSRFVRGLANGSERTRAIRMLARLGFADVITAEEVIGIAADFGRVDTGRAGDILDGVEFNAGDALARGVFCRVQIGMAYATAIWKLANSGDLDRRLSTQLLQRLEHIDGTHSTRLLEQALAKLCLMALADRESSFIPAGAKRYKLDRSSTAGTLWSALAEWLAEHPSREAAARRAIACAWAMLDSFDGPTSQAQWAPLGLVADILIQDAGFNTDIPSPSAVVAVMSGDWKERPLATRVVTFSLEDSHTDRPVEDLLQAAARVLDEDAEHRSDGTSLLFDFVPMSGGPSANVSVPFEAAILRATPTGASRAATRLAAGIGVADGRLRRALLAFAQAPTDRALRKDLAHAACNSLFRLVKDEARFLLCIGDHAIPTQQGFSATLADLRELLSEPPQLLTGETSGVAETEMPLEFARRLDDDGFWGGRSDRAELLHFASRVPGRLPAEAARSLIGNVDAEELCDIVAVLRSSTTRSIGELSLAIGLASFACFGEYGDATKAGLVEALSDMLKQEANEPADADSLAAAEPAALNAVGRLVGRLAVVPMQLKEHAWLTQRLYEWWVRTASSKDVVVLSRGERMSSWSEVRTEVALNVILDVLEVQLIGLRKSPLPLKGLLASLVDLACSRHGNPFEPSRRVPGWFYWRRPQGVGWLASSIALWIDPGSFFDLRPEIRLAVLDRLPRTTSDAETHGVSFASFVPALSRFVSRLTSAESDAVRDWISTAESSVLLDLWRADVLTSFVEAHGNAADAAQLRGLVALESLADARPELLAGYLEAIATSEREHLHESVFEMAEAIDAASGAEVVARGVELALARPRADRVKRLLQVLEGLAAVSDARNTSPFVRTIRTALVGDGSAVSESSTDEHLE